MQWRDDTTLPSARSVTKAVGKSLGLKITRYPPPASPTNEFSGLLRSDIEQLHARALKAQHGEEAFAELGDLEAGIKIADDAVKAAREEIAFEVGGTAKLDEAAKPYEKLQSAAWLKKFGDEVRSFHVNGNRGHWIAATEDEIENGMYFRSADEWRLAQGGIAPLTMEKSNGGL
jgi:hypothetical protein